MHYQGSSYHPTGIISSSMPALPSTAISSHPTTTALSTWGSLSPSSTSQDADKGTFVRIDSANKGTDKEGPQIIPKPKGKSLVFIEPVEDSDDVDEEGWDMLIPDDEDESASSDVFSDI